MTDLDVRILNHVDKSVKRDEITKKLVLDVGMSAFSSDPLNLFLLGPSSTGKTYTVLETIKYFPESRVIILGGLSATALVHDYGKLVDLRTNKEIDFSEKPHKCSADKDGKIFESDMKVWREKLKNSAYVVDLSHKIMVFLEPPNYETFTRLRPILSHDRKEISYKFTDKKAGGLRTVHVVLKGWPATIFCSSGARYMEDLITRSLTHTPEMSEEKYHEANIVSAKRVEFPWLYSEGLDLEFQSIKEELNRIVEESLKVTVLIPFSEKLAEVFPSSLPENMRHFKHFLSLIEQKTRLNIWNRLVISEGNNINILAEAKDFYSAFEIFKQIQETTETGLPNHILQFFKTIFLPCEDLFAEIEVEKFAGVKIENLVDRYGSLHKRALSSSSVYQYLRELGEAGYVDARPNPEDKRSRIYTSIKKVENVVDCLSTTFLASFSEKDFENYLRSIKNYYISNTVLLKWKYLLSMEEFKKGEHPEAELTEVWNENLGSLVKDEFKLRYFSEPLKAESGSNEEKKPKDAKVGQSTVISDSKEA